MFGGVSDEEFHQLVWAVIPLALVYLKLPIIVLSVKINMTSLGEISPNFF